MSLFGKILAFVNVLAAVAFFSLAAMDWGKRQAWAYTLYRHNLAITGLPVTADETDKDGVPWVEGLTQKTLQELFKPVGGSNLVKTQLEEVEAVRDRLQARLSETDPKETKLQKQARFLLPLAQSGSRREWLIKTAAGESVEAHGVFDLAFETELLKPENAAADKRGPLLEARLQADFGGAFEQVLRTQTGDKQRDPGEQRLAIAGLLIALAELQPDDLTAGGSADVLESNAYKRALTVVGLETALKELQAQADTLKAMVPGVISDIENERATFAGRYQKVFGQLLVLAKDFDDRDQFFKRQVAAEEKYLSVIGVRNKQIAELTARSDQLKAATDAEIVKQTSLQNRLFGEMKELRDVGTENQRLEKEIRKLEAER